MTIRLIDERDYSVIQDFYPEDFETLLEEGDIYVYEEDGRVRGAVASRTYSVVFHGKALKASLFYPCCGDNEEIRNALTEALIDMKSHTELLSLSYEKIEGFDALGKREWAIFDPERTILPDTYEVSFDIKEEDMMKCYGLYMNYFDGYSFRMENDMTKKKEEALKNGSVLSATRNEEVRGYCFYREREEEIFVDEMVYLDSNSLCSMLGYLLDQKKRVFVNTAPIETWNFLGEHVRLEGKTLYGRINDIELFNKLYMCSVKDNNEAFSLLKKCVNFQEDQGL